jgi:hypothetical protein
MVRSIPSFLPCVFVCIVRAGAKIVAVACCSLPQKQCRSSGGSRDSQHTAVALVEHPPLPFFFSVSEVASVLVQHITITLHSINQLHKQSPHTSFGYIHPYFHPTLHHFYERVNMASTKPYDAQASTNYKEAFALFDKRGNQRVALESLGDLLRACGQNPTLSEIRDLEKNIGSDCISPSQTSKRGRD